MPVPFINDMLEELLALRAEKAQQFSEHLDVVFLLREDKSALLAALKGLGVSARLFAHDAAGLCFMDCYLTEPGSHHPPCAAARAAIAKAEGR